MYLPIFASIDLKSFTSQCTSGLKAQSMLFLPTDSFAELHLCCLGIAALAKARELHLEAKLAIFCTYTLRGSPALDPRCQRTSVSAC